MGAIVGAAIGGTVAVAGELSFIVACAAKLKQLKRQAAPLGSASAFPSITTMLLPLQLSS
jgi:hypothetical protein